jgi:hypothetical protein
MSGIRYDADEYLRFFEKKEGHGKALKIQKMRIQDKKPDFSPDVLYRPFPPFPCAVFNS